MRRAKRRILGLAAAFLATGGGLAVLSGCTSGRPAEQPRGKETAMETSMRTDIDGLARLVGMPRQPEQVWWETLAPGAGGLGPNDRQLIAVMRFRPEELEALLAQASPASFRDPLLPAALWRDWFPAPLKARIDRDADGNLLLKGDLLEPSAFVRSPFLNGYLMRAGDSDLVFLYLFTT